MKSVDLPLETYSSMSMSSIYDRWDDTRFLRYNVGDARYMYPGNEGEETHVWMVSMKIQHGGCESTEGIRGTIPYPA
jgi:hypothetical protein